MPIYISCYWLFLNYCSYYSSIDYIYAVFSISFQVPGKFAHLIMESVRRIWKSRPLVSHLWKRAQRSRGVQWKIYLCSKKKTLQSQPIIFLKEMWWKSSTRNRFECRMGNRLYKVIYLWLWRFPRKFLLLSILLEFEKFPTNWHSSMNLFYMRSKAWNIPFSDWYNLPIWRYE